MAKSKRIATGAGMIPELGAVLPTDEGQLTTIQISAIVSAIQALIRTVNGKIGFGDGTNSSQSGNIDGHTKEVTFTSANTDYEVPHDIGRVPIGILVLNVNADGAVVRGSNVGSWSATRIFVRCNVAGATGLFVVV